MHTNTVPLRSTPMRYLPKQQGVSKTSARICMCNNRWKRFHMVYMMQTVYASLPPELCIVALPLDPMGTTPDTI